MPAISAVSDMCFAPLVLITETGSELSGGALNQALRRDCPADEDAAGRHAAQGDVASLCTVGIGKHFERLDALRAFLRQPGLGNVGGGCRSARDPLMGEAMQVEHAGSAQHLLDLGASELRAQQPHELELAVGTRGEIGVAGFGRDRSEEHTSELQSPYVI